MHYDKNDPTTYNNRMGRYKTKTHLKFIQQFAPGKGLRILDNGGGNGRLAVPLADLGYKVTVVDESPVAIEALSKEQHPGIECVIGNMEQFEGRVFDLIIAVDSVKYTHLPLPELFFMFNRLIAPGGLFIIMDINTASWRYKLSGIFGRYCHYNIGSADEYRSALDKAGFETIGMKGFNWMPFTFNSNSPLVGAFAAIEDGLKLNQWINQSPWLMIAGRKK